MKQKINKRNEWIYFGLGVAYFNEQKYEKAMRQLQVVLDLNPLHDGAYTYLGIIDKLLGNTYEAKSKINKALELNPTNELAQLQLLQLGTYFTQNRQYEEAIHIYFKLLKINPACIDGYLWLGMTYRILGKTEHAIIQLMHGLELNDFHEALNIELGIAYYEIGDYNNSLLVFNKVLQFNPSNVSAMIHHAAANRSQGHMGAAKSQLKSALKLDPTDETVNVQLGVTYHAEGNHKEAIQYFQKSIEANVSSYAGHINISKIYRTIGELDKAKYHLAQALKSNPQNKWTYYQLGLLCLEENRYPDAVKWFSELLTINPSIDSHYRYVGVICKKRLAEKIAKADDNIKSNKTREYTNFNEGLTCFAEERHEEAAMKFNNVINYNPSSDAGYFFLAVILRLQGKTKEAISCLEKALIVDRGIEWIHFELGLAYLAEGNTEESIKFLSQKKIEPLKWWRLWKR
jgi:tetratricopeptide (TPR) repeat protein